MNRRQAMNISSLFQPSFKIYIFIQGKLYFLKKEIITFEEKNTTYRAKARYFELFPISGLKFLIPREVFILNKNLDAISALIILEDYCKTKFTLNQNIDFKTWQK